MAVILERVNLALLGSAGACQPHTTNESHRTGGDNAGACTARIVQPHRATLKRGEVIGLLEKPDSRCNISFVRSGWVECLAIAEAARDRSRLGRSHIVSQGPRC